MSNRIFWNAFETAQKLLNKDIKNYQPSVIKQHKECDYPAAIENVELKKELEEKKIDFSSAFDDRFLRCRGQGARDLYTLRYGKFHRLPDLVVWPRCHEDVVFVVQLANIFCAIIIPFAGGTNTMLSLSYTKLSDRFLISLDTTQMNRILWIDKISMLACVESGIVGMDMEEELKKRGLTVGHSPDSIEFSTVGGWIATRSSGMKQQTYGNIEDIVTKLTLVTSVDVLEKNFLAPRVSIGPDFDHIAMGSEGTLGVITKVVVKLHAYPAVQRYGSIVFPDFETGIKFMYEVSKFPLKPSSLRLIDNCHCKLGLGFRHNKNLFHTVLDKSKMILMEKLLRYDFDTMALGTYHIEGEKADVDNIEGKLKKLSRKYSGLNGGSKNGRDAYLWTYTNAYVRDALFDLGFIFDSLEPSVIWERCVPLIEAIRNTWNAEMQQRKLDNLLAIRISQIYDTGACVYFYYGIGATSDKDQLETFEELTEILRAAIERAHGSISHHHGIGKKNQKWYPQAVSKVAVDVFKTIKSQIDPNNVFDCGNLVGVDGKL